MGIYILLATVTLACFKTSVALIVSCSEMFSKMFPKFWSMKQWTIAFTLFSFVVSNFGLDAIITYAIPFLMFIYPLAISLILLALFGKSFGFNKKVFSATIFFTFIAALFDFVVSFPKDSFLPVSFIESVASFQSKLPFASIGLAWLVPAVFGLVVGLIWAKTSKN
jgi:LIVCS family branched-chain amino acid:cation transporter